jgi:hypothetical protein
MDLLNALDEIKSQNNRNAKVDTRKVIDAMHRSEAEEREEGLRLDEEDEAELKDLRRMNVGRIDDNLEKAAVLPSSSQQKPDSSIRNKKRSVGVSFATKVKPKFIKVAKKEEKADVQQSSGSKAESGALAGLLGSYASSDESD